MRSFLFPTRHSNLLPQTVQPKGGHYNLRFPELYRKMALMGAEVFLVASAWPFPRLEAWLMLNRVRALENQVFLISSNCTGFSKGKELVGHSMVVDPWCPCGKRE